jgi:uncharacterized membrane protein
MTDDIPIQQKEKRPKFSPSDLIPWVYGIILLFVFIALFQLYISIQQVIALWFSTEYIPLVQSLFFIAVIVTGLYIIFFRNRAK